MKSSVFHLLLATCASVHAVEPVEFNRDVRPILTKNCTTCHGGVKKAGGVSYLYREDTLGKGESGKMIVVPRKPQDSEMIARLTSQDPDERMPPPDHHPKPLPKEEIATLTRWIEQGAVWGTHWAFRKPENPPLPRISATSWPMQDLDRFILARLESEKLGPSPEAEPAEWLRRVSLDLTGLPPSLEEFAEFERAIAGGREEAYAAVVDRLLASPTYGEKWAAMWLDLARYSDTFGFERDPARTIWPFRDWVIDAFNSDMPFDQFTIKQLAGDLLEKPEPGDLIATAFHRNTQNNSEGGTDDEEYRTAAVIDRVNTTWTAWNATTFGCVQCHSHPYDPIPHESYYNFLAIFNNSEDVDINSEWPRTKFANKKSLQGEVVKLEEVLRERRETMNGQLRGIAGKIGDWQPLIFDKAITIPATGKLDQDAKQIVVTSGTTPTNCVFALESEAKPLSVIQVEIFPEEDDPAKWRGHGAVISGFEASYVSADGKRREIPLREVAADFLAGPFDPNDSLEKGDSGFGDYPMMKSPRTAWFIAAEPVVPASGERLAIRIRHGAKCNETQNTVLPRFRISVSADASLTRFLATEEHRKIQEEVANLKTQYDGIPGTMIPVMVERSKSASRESRIFIRGNRMTLDKVVQPRVPELFGGPKETTDRLAMARWLVSNNNPLAARVLANRLWAEIFGIGIVETLEDFGSSGALPSHPELLDFLALRLRDGQQWHIKPFLKELVLSATYRQANRTSPALLEKDPRNRLLARGPRNRLTAEMVRDQALAVSGLLSAKMGGPSVFPPQPEGIWRGVYSDAKWNTSTGEDRNRRAIYTYNKRTAGYPSFLTFDGSSRDVCLARRVTTNTPLQALVTLNDPAYIEFSREFAKRMSGPDLRARLNSGFRMLTLRDARPAVIDTLVHLYDEALAEYQKEPAESAKLAAGADEAAMVIVANTLLNSDSALNR